MSPAIVNRKQAVELKLIYKTALNTNFSKNANFLDPDVIESLFLKILVPHIKNFIVGCVYRPPNQKTTMFIEKFNNILSLISKDKHCYVMGDFNLYFVQYNHHVPRKEFIDSFFSHAFIPLISNPTCPTS